MLKEIASVLRQTGNLECLKAAENLENKPHPYRTLHFRSLDLKPQDILALATIIEQATQETKAQIKSISFSYNNLMGDAGATALAGCLPPSICEIGLVGCGIGDKGGYEMLHWMKTATNLHMICMEQNNFSEKLKMEITAFQKKNPEVMIVL